MKRLVYLLAAIVCVYGAAVELETGGKYVVKNSNEETVVKRFLVDTGQTCARLMCLTHSQLRQRGPRELTLTCRGLCNVQWEIYITSPFSKTSILSIYRRYLRESTSNSHRVMTSKVFLYRTMRSHGLGLYSSKNWLNVSGANTCMLKRFLSVPVHNPMDEEVGMLDKLKQRMGFKGKLQYYPSTLHHSGFRLYLSAAEAPRYNKIYDYIKLPDTMVTWHKLTSLHIWLIMVRLASEGREGKIVRNETIEAFNTDMRAKSKMIAKETKLAVQGEEMERLYEMFLAALMNYDEGVLGSDRHLAGALWRSLFSLRPDMDPTDLETMVAYVRKQVAYLQQIDSKSMLTNGLIPFLPVVGNTVPQSTIEVLQSIVKSDLQLKKS